MNLDTCDVKPNGSLLTAESLEAWEKANGIPEEPGTGTAGEPEAAKYPLRDGYFLESPEGVFWCSGDDPKLRVCDRLRAEAETRDAHSNNWGLMLAWLDGGGKRHCERMPKALLHGDATEAVRMLASGGLHIEPGRAPKLREYLQVCRPDGKIRTVEQYGWHGGAYVTPEGTIGDAGAERIVFQAASGVAPAAAVYGRSGTAQGWRETVAKLASGNSRLGLALCSAFAGPLLHIAGVESGGLHLVGPSSSGKTTALRAAASVWGDPESYVRTWRATANGLEGIAAVHNDGLLILDELSQCEAKQAGEAAYMLANGKGKARASRTGGAREAASWRLLFLSSGEQPLSVHMEGAGRRINAGQEVRLANVAADAGQGWGIFDNLHGYASPADLANALRGAGARHCGIVGQLFLGELVKQHGANAAAVREVLTQGVEDFVSEYAPGASGQAGRVARRFGLLAASGELATAYGLTGWGEGEADRSCGVCFRAWLQDFGAGSHEDRALEEQVRGFLVEHGASRFQKASDPNALTIRRAGWWRGEEDGPRQYLVPSVTFKEEVVKGYDPKRAAQTLREKGLLLPGGDGKSSQALHIPASGQKSTRVYVLVLGEEKA